MIKPWLSSSTDISWHGHLLLVHSICMFVYQSFSWKLLKCFISQDTVGSRVMTWLNEYNHVTVFGCSWLWLINVTNESIFLLPSCIPLRLWGPYDLEVCWRFEVRLGWHWCMGLSLEWVLYYSSRIGFLFVEPVGSALSYDATCTYKVTFHRMKNKPHSLPQFWTWHICHLRCIPTIYA